MKRQTNTFHHLSRSLKTGNKTESDETVPKILRHSRVTLVPKHDEVFKCCTALRANKHFTTRETDLLLQFTPAITAISIPSSPKRFSPKVKFD